MREQIDKLVEVLKKEEASRQLDYVQGMIDAAINYVRSIVTMESRIKILQFRLDPEEYREAVEKLDRTRRLAHNGFIAKLDAVNRICTNHGLPAIYSGDDNRGDKGEFAFDIVQEYKVNVKG